MNVALNGGTGETSLMSSNGGHRYHVRSAILSRYQWWYNDQVVKSQSTIWAALGLRALPNGKSSRAKQVGDVCG